MGKVAAKGRASKQATQNGISNGAVIPVEEPKKVDRRAEHLRQYAAKPGQVLNPKGRPKGSRNKVAEAFISDILADWEIAGAAAIQSVRLNDPSTYLRVVAGLVPKEFSLGGNKESDLERFFEQFTDEQLIEVERAIAAITAIPVKQG